jgi:D-sedoheptulose 7-phosphate isomerase
MRQKIIASVQDSVRAVQQLLEPAAVAFVENSALALARSFSAGGKLLLAGNGGSLCDAAHFCEELTGFFRQKRAALPAIVLGDAGHLTCVGNDIGFDEVFARGVEALGKPGDVFVGLTTSGNSPNIVKAFETAKERGLFTIAYLGKDGGRLKGVADLELIIRDFPTYDRIQEAHMTAIHTTIEILEELLFSKPPLHTLAQLVN